MLITKKERGERKEQSHKLYEKIASPVLLKARKQIVLLSKFRKHLHEKLILIGIVRPPQADNADEEDRRLPEEQRRARNLLRELTLQRRAQYHR